MLELNSVRWSEFRDAYGPASQVAGLLAQLKSFPAESRAKGNPWFELWSRLCHQGDVFPASFAAIPHIIAIGESAPDRTTLSFFLLPAAVETARFRRSIEAPAELIAEYRAALDRIPTLVAAAATRPWSSDYCQAALAAIAASRAQYELASLLTSVASPEIREVLEWYDSR